MGFLTATTKLQISLNNKTGAQIARSPALDEIRVGARLNNSLDVLINQDWVSIGIHYDKACRSSGKFVGLAHDL
jgi:hypothetical protein